MITKEELRAIILEEVEANPDIVGAEGTGWLFQQITEKYNFCIKDVIEIGNELSKEGITLKDGRHMIQGESTVWVSKDYVQKAYGHKYLHTGELNCVPRSEIIDS